MEQGKKEIHNRPIWLIVLLDLLLTGLLLAVFAFFQIELPVLRARAEAAPGPVPTPLVTSASAAAAETLRPSATPDERTPWQLRFADHFTPEVVRTETSYTSPEVSVTLETMSRTLRSTHSVSSYRQAVCHVADIYVADIENFRTYTANNELAYLSVQNILEMDLASDAIVSISGDCYSYQRNSFLLRNGVPYMTEKPYCDICVLYRDGSMEIYRRDEYEVEDILARDPWQVWSFGPSLLDKEGQPMTTYETSYTVNFTNPRTAIGYYEPGHYCFVVVDGRQRGYSDGMFLWELAELFSELGCTAAYNLDGGGSSMMVFDHELYSQPSNGDRQIGDILLIAEREGEK